MDTGQIKVRPSSRFLNVPGHEDIPSTPFCAVTLTAVPTEPVDPCRHCPLGPPPRPRCTVVYLFISLYKSCFLSRPRTEPIVVVCVPFISVFLPLLTGLYHTSHSSFLRDLCPGTLVVENSCPVSYCSGGGFPERSSSTFLSPFASLGS